MKKLFIYLFAALAVASCEHKDLCYDHSHTIDVEVVFDWRNASEAAPESMSLYLFPTNGGEALRYEFTDCGGGTIRVPVGNYGALCLNSDGECHLSQYGSKDDFRSIYSYDRSVVRPFRFGCAVRRCSSC